MGGDEIVLNNINGYLVNEDNFGLFAKKIIDTKNLDFEKNLNEINKKVHFYDLEHNSQKIISSYRGLL